MGQNHSPIIDINGRKIGFNYPAYIIAEAGLNHNGDVKIAKKLVDQALNCGVDAIKFQTYISEEFLASSSEYFDFFKNVELSKKDFEEISNYAKDVGLTFFSAPFDNDSVDFLDNLNVPCFKIASSDITNYPLVKKIAQKKKPIIISTGASTINEIQNTIDWCLNEKNDKIALLHCVVNYPTLPEETNLLAMNVMKKKFDVPVGYSDNGESTLVDLVAVSLGATIIEKHFTLDKTMDGPDHSFSIEPPQLKILVSEIRMVESIRGKEIKSIQLSEEKIKPIVRKSITAKINLNSNDVIDSTKISIKRPSGGIEPIEYEKVLGKKVKNSILKDKIIQWQDLY
jgi:N,N'-diacetyllegionaminate synthase